MTPEEALSEILQACKLKLGDLKGALFDAEFALHEEDNNVKAFFRQGQAHMALHDIDAAVESFKNALVLEPNDVSSYDHIRGKIKIV
ncbi:peptidyl-prolyl cis-trans isomerase CYP40 [Arachis duranensis]|uniref:Peptidyl-prolyl cis-trans isomerase CYP40 n=1 Tax=Arachis duranensis TaxID=130453 RepID=A0A9C6TDK6_ARADU|nr:peptidyl-prolyl cis-trans isomerase CYP40 [Arachis duranensis]